MGFLWELVMEAVDLGIVCGLGYVQDRLGAAAPRDNELGLEELTLVCPGVPSHLTPLFPPPYIHPHPTLDCVTSGQRRKELEVEKLRLETCPAGVRVGRPSG